MEDGVSTNEGVPIEVMEEKGPSIEECTIKVGKPDDDCFISTGHTLRCDIINWLRPEFTISGIVRTMRRIKQDAEWDTLRFAQWQFEFRERHWRWWHPNCREVLMRLDDHKRDWWDVPAVQVARSDGVVVYDASVQMVGGRV
jgi:hypothetical protein